MDAAEALITDKVNVLNTVTKQEAEPVEERQVRRHQREDHQPPPERIPLILGR